VLIIDDDTLTGVVRGEISFARDQGMPVDKELALSLAMADLLELPDDVPFLPAVCAAAETPTQLNDRASIARTREVALAAGYSEPARPAGLA
jgi:hypothetical protein